jgi:hypothetical protein
MVVMFEIVNASALGDNADKLLGAADSLAA